jgi:hypothetical protein
MPGGLSQTGKVHRPGTAEPGLTGDGADRGPGEVASATRRFSYPLEFQCQPVSRMADGLSAGGTGSA